MATYYKSAKFEVVIFGRNLRDVIYEWPLLTIIFFQKSVTKDESPGLTKTNGN